MKMYVCSWCDGIDGVSLDVGTPQCQNCSQLAVLSIADAHTAFQSVLQWVDTHFRSHRLGKSQFFYGGLQPDPQLQSALGRTEIHSNGREVNVRILTVSGLPNFVLSAIIAHEIGHALLLLDENTLQLREQWPTNDLVIEGFCEVIASQWLETQSDPESQKLRSGMNTNPTPVYGDGFRLMYQEFLNYGSLREFRDALVSPQGLLVEKSIDNDSSALIDSRPIITMLPPHIPLKTNNDEDTDDMETEGQINQHRPVILMKPHANLRSSGSKQTTGRPTIHVKQDKK